jgi:hypothetical protein
MYARLSLIGYFRIFSRIRGDILTQVELDAVVTGPVEMFNYERF